MNCAVILKADLFAVPPETLCLQATFVLGKFPQMKFYRDTLMANFNWIVDPEMAGTARGKSEAEIFRNGFRARLDMELFINMTKMGADGVNAEADLVANFAYKADLEPEQSSTSCSRGVSKFCFSPAPLAF